MSVVSKILFNVYSQMEKSFRASGIIPGKSGRHMKFPYTFSAKIAQFPIFFHMKYNFMWMYYPLAVIFSFPVFLKIHNLVNSEAAVRNWEESQRLSAEKEHAEH